ncbi:hypothetical protein [Actibacterium sp. 188UL27-1]|uniref:hypothetical protein n=1 Tax=Actibacterium sp. 188UL27-1 TaxID=2786961 RepID=UPI00195CD518|nr:hypothetical protein [Actibacterium sp. 188UL27-1]MBM7069072.1 hypothetical protein [Actibacterium sp. 188UL27-1]
MIPQFTVTDFFLAVVTTLLGAALSYALVQGIPLIGIDDAAITRSYAENVANGHGYVYNVGGERVEGSTALLWVGLLTIIYSAFPDPELPILALSAGITVFSIYLSLRMVRWFSYWLQCDVKVAVGALVVFLIASPGYFLWSVWTMMELAIWSMLLLWLTLMLVKLVEVEAGILTRIGIVLAALILPTVRPEGIAVALGLIILAGVLRVTAWRTCLASGAAAIAVFLAITTFRLSYFGWPVPNTFYAKVSSDTIQGIKDGLKYLLDFLQNSPMADLFLVVWAALVLFAILRLRQDMPGTRALLIAGATIFGILAVYAGLGGDHFALWRFYQPIAPLFPVAAALAVALGVTSVSEWQRGYGTSLSLSALAAAMVLSGLGWMHYYQARFDVQKEFTLVERGLGFGNYLNRAEPLPTIGIGPAGGIALAYEGEILDLLGLNWVEMAHANPVKVGLRNHASFDRPTFWKHKPDMLAAFNRRCGDGDGLQFWSTDDAAFDGLFTDEQFRETYQPVVFREGEDCWPAFALPDWLDTAKVEGMRVLEWDEVTILK